jgi:hypothetical protein
MSKRKGPGKKTFTKNKPSSWERLERQQFLDDEKVFIKAYITAYPNLMHRWNRGKVLYPEFHDIIWWFNYINYSENHSFSYLAGRSSAESVIRDKSMWLFHGYAVEDFEERMRALVIEKNDSSLTIGDYAMLLFASYQDAETSKNLSTMPLSMLHDIFAPISNKNFTEWQAR